MAIVVVTPPSETIVGIDEVKAHLKVDFTDDDAHIAALIRVAIDYVQNQTQRRLAVQQVDWITDNLSSGMRLPLAPVVSVDSLTYLKYPYGPAALMDPSWYIVAPDGQATVITRPYNLIWPWIGQGAAPVTIRFTVGGAALVSESVKHAIKIIVANLYEHRETAKYGRGTAAEMNLTGGALSAIDALLYAERWQ